MGIFIQMCVPVPIIVNVVNLFHNAQRLIPSGYSVEATFVSQSNNKTKINTHIPCVFPS